MIGCFLAAKRLDPPSTKRVSSFSVAKVDRWFSAALKISLHLRPRFFSFPFPARAMNSGLVLHVIHS